MTDDNQAALVRDLRRAACGSHRDIVEQVLAPERGGLDLVGIQDHPYGRRFLDTFALIADLLARTGASGSSRTSRTCRCGGQP